MTPEYRYFLVDILSDRTLAEVELSDVEFNFALSAAGAWSAKWPLSDDVVRQINPTSVSTLGRTALWVMREGVLLYGGPLWSRRYKRKDRTFELGGSDWYSYLYHRFLSANRNYDGWKPGDIVQDLISYAQGFDGGNIGLMVDNQASSAPSLPEFSFAASDLEYIADIIDDLSDEDNGIEFAMDVRYVGDRREKRLSLHHPTRGRSATAQTLVFNDSNISDYTLAESGTSLANDLFVVGAGEGNEARNVRRTNPAAWQEGVPRLQANYEYKNVQDPARLERLADTAIQQDALPEIIMDLEVIPDRDPAIGSYIVGDWARIEVQDDRFPSGAVFNQRIIGMKVQPPRRAEPEKVTVQFGGTAEVVRW